MEDYDELFKKHFKPVILGLCCGMLITTMLALVVFSACTNNDKASANKNVGGKTMIEVVIQGIEGNTIKGELVIQGGTKKFISSDVFVINISNEAAGFAKWIEDKFYVDLPFKGRVPFTLQLHTLSKMLKCIDYLNT